MNKLVGLLALISILIVTGMYFSGENKITGFTFLEKNNDVTPTETCPASCDDKNSCTNDYCNDYTKLCEHDYFCTQPKCSDDTPFGQCSGNISQFCDLGVLIEKCTVCGCSDEEICNNDSSSSTYNQCLEPKCLDDFDCNDYNDNTKDTCMNPNKILSNGSTGATCEYQLRARGRLNIAIVEFNQPDLTYGNTIHACNEDGCFVIQEEVWNNVKNSYCGTDLSECNYTEQFNYKTVLNSDYTRKETFDYDCLVDDNIGECTYYSLYYIEDWFKDEVEKYKADFYADVTVLGPYNTNTLPPRRSNNDDCKILDTYFADEVIRQNIDIEDYNVVVYLYFTNAATGNAFSSCNTTNAYVSYSGVDLGIISANKLTNVLSSVISELMNRFGATGDVLVSHGNYIEDYELTDKTVEEIGWK